MMTIDIHTHAFPDALAKRAVRHLSEEGNVPACLDGTVSALLESMDGAGIARAVIASIATKPSQFRSIIDWSGQIASDRILPFPSIHPLDPEWEEHVAAVAERGFRGIKLHPYYQDFAIDAEHMFPLYDAFQARGLVVLMHAGFDMAFERIRQADPVRIARVLDAFPRLNLVASHLGAWEDWDEVRRHLIGRSVYLDTAYSLAFMPPTEARDLILAHPPEYVLFGSDSPWDDQRDALDQLDALGLPPRLQAAIRGGNALRLLGLDGHTDHLVH